MGVGVGAIQLVPIVATVQLHLSQQWWDYFYKACTSDSHGSRLKTCKLNELKGKEFPICDTASALTVLFFSHSTAPRPDICQVCVPTRRGPISSPHSYSLHHPLPPPCPLSLILSPFHSLPGRVALLSSHKQDLWSQGLWQKQKGICQYLWETLRQPPPPPPPPTPPLVLTASLGMHLSDT